MGSVDWGGRRRPRVTDPVRFRPDPANQNFKNRIRVLLAFTKYQYKQQIFFKYHSDFFRYFNVDFFEPESMEKFTKALFFKKFDFFYNTLHSQSRIRIRIRTKFSGSGKKVRTRKPDMANS